MDREGSSTSEFEKICLAGEESSDEEPETSQLRLCDHGDQHTSKATFYRHQIEP